MDPSPAETQPSVVVCEGCGGRNVLERREFSSGERITLTCHDCESVIVAFAPRDLEEHRRLLRGV